MGQLPWQNLNVKEDEKVKKVGEMKMKMTPEELCKGLPEEILKYLIYIKTLGFRDTPEYNYLKGLIMKAIVGNNFINDCKFDWTVFPKSENKKEEEAKKNEKKKKEFLPLTTKSQVRGSLRSEEIIFNNLMVPTPDIFKDNNGSSYLSSNVGSSVCMQYEKTESIKKKKNATTCNYFSFWFFLFPTFFFLVANILLILIYFSPPFLLFTHFGYFNFLICFKFFLMRQKIMNLESIILEHW